MKASEIAGEVEQGRRSVPAGECPSPALAFIMSERNGKLTIGNRVAHKVAVTAISDEAKVTRRLHVLEIQIQKMLSQPDRNVINFYSAQQLREERVPEPRRQNPEWWKGEG